MSFERGGRDVTMVGVSIARYVASWYLRERTWFVSQAGSDRTVTSLTGSARNFLADGPDDFLEIGVSGSESVCGSSATSTPSKKSPRVEASTSLLG